MSASESAVTNGQSNHLCADLTGINGTGSKKVVLAYSGGLDTSCILYWFIEHGFDVICYTADVGQEEDYEELKERALKIGASKAIVDNRQQEFVDDFILPSLAYGGLYQGRYLMGTSLARPVISKGMVEVAQKEKAEYIAHGATGKGNDQIRFELSCAAIDSSIKCLAPWRMPTFYKRFKGRLDLLEYAKAKGIKVSASLDKPYSIDANLMHISIESGILEDPWNHAPEATYYYTSPPSKWPKEPEELLIDFLKGIPVQVHNKATNETVVGSLKIFKYLNKIGGKHGIGRIDIVEDRFIGMKSRGIYETPGATIIFNAVRDLEVCCLDMEVNKIRAYLADVFSVKTYNGLWFSPECEYVRNCLNLSQQEVNGSVYLRLYSGSTYILGRKATNSLYDQELVSMDVLGSFTPAHAEGFIQTNAIRLRTFRDAHDTNPYTGKPWSK